MNTMTEAELKIANILWDEPGISAMGLCARCEDLYGWKRSTTYTLLKRMRDKELVRLDEKGLTILVARDTYYREKTDEMIGTAYRGSLPMFMNAFMKGRKLTPEEAETKTGSRVFVFRIPLSGEHTVKAVSGEYTDTMTIRRCKTPDPGYRFKEAGSVSNWFDEDTFRTDCFSVRDSYGVLPAHPEAGKLVQEIMNIVIASRGDVAKSANSNPNLQKMMAGMSFESLLKKAGDTIPQETAEELNRKLQQIKKN